MIKLIDLEVYKEALEIGDRIWKTILGWDLFSRDTPGKQFVNAADSIALNIAEGYGRFHYKENKNFCYYSRGSAFEATACLKKAHQRGLITKDENSELRQLLGQYFRLINSYINSIGKSGSSNIVEENQESYEVDDHLNEYLSNHHLSEDSLIQDR